LGRAGASAGVPTKGSSAIDVAQPPSASADSAATANALVFRPAVIRSKVPTCMSRWYEPCSDKTSASRIYPQSFKPLSLETIKA
jgi:hypothetical protein